MAALIYTDSCSDLTEALAGQYGIQVIPMQYTVKGADYLDDFGRSQSYHDFYESLRHGDFSQTSQITEQRYLEIFTPVLERGDDVLYICFSSGLSGSYNSALLAQKELQTQFPERSFLVVDSLSASLGQGLLVVLAARFMQQGHTLEQTAQWVEEHRLQLCHWFTVDDLNHLRRGGRVSSVSAFVGTVLDIKPVLHVDDAGHLIAMEKTRGRRKALRTLVDKMEKTAIDPSEQIVFISHGDALEDAQLVARMVAERMHPAQIELGYIGPVIGTHSGPGTVALFFLGTAR